MPPSQQSARDFLGGHNQVTDGCGHGKHFFRSTTSNIRTTMLLSASIIPTTEPYMVFLKQCIIAYAQLVRKTGTRIKINERAQTSTKSQHHCIQKILSFPKINCCKCGYLQILIIKTDHGKLRCFYAITLLQRILSLLC